MTTSDIDTAPAALRRLHERAARAAGRAAAATALVPATCAGADPTGAVTVTLDAAGLPTAVRVAADWPRRLTADAFGAAVTAACRAAQYARLDEWGDRLSRSPLPRPAEHVPSGTGRVTTADDLRRRLLDATPAPVAGSASDGRDAAGRLGVTIDRHGLSDCTADPRWVAGQSAARLAAAVGEAVRQARDARAAGGGGHDGTGVLRGIGDDAVALLEHLARAGR